jgi:hypothetical protein
MGDDREDVKTLSDLSYWRHASLAGTTSGVAQTIRPSQRADLFCVTGSTLTMVTRAGNSLAVAFNSGQPVSLDGRVFASFSATATDWAYAIVPRDAIPTFPSTAPGGGGTGNLSITGYLTVQNGQSSLTSLNLLVAGTGPADILKTDGAQRLVISSPSGLIQLNSFEATNLAYFDKTFVTYNGVNTAGLGIPAIYAASTQTGKINAAPTTVTYGPPSTAGIYRASGYVEVTTATSIALKLKLLYGSPGGTDPVTDSIVFTNQGSTTLLTSLVGNGRYYFSHQFGIDASGTNIQLEDNAGTYTTCVYNLNYILEQLA